GNSTVASALSAGFVANGGLRCRHNFYYRLQRNCEHTPNKCRSEPRPFMTWRSGRSCAESRRTMRKWHSGSNSTAAKRGSSCGGRSRNVAHHGRKGTLVRRGRPTRAILFICAAVGGGPMPDQKVRLLALEARERAAEALTIAETFRDEEARRIMREV